MGLIYQERPDRGVTYVYSSKSYYDPEKKQSRSKRKLIGKVDPETGEIVPTGKSGRKKAASQTAAGGNGKPGKREGHGKDPDGADMAGLKQRLDAQEKEIRLLKDRISILESDNEKLRTEKEKAVELLGRQRKQLEVIAGEAVSMAGKMKGLLSIR